MRLRPEHRAIQLQRQPLQYVVVLDAGGSMSANYAGQCDQGPGGTLPAIVQCANGPDGAPPVEVTSTGISYYWNEPTERRFYVAKQALERLVRRLNMPGNPGYDPTLPADQLALVWFNQGAGTTNVRWFSSSPATIISNLTSAGIYNNDPYRTSGGTNWAAGLYRAALSFEQAPATVLYDGQTWSYERKVVLLTDSISNQFLDSMRSNLQGGYSDISTYPVGHQCRVPEVVEIASCQTTIVGGTYNGMDRPITQAVYVSKGYLQVNGIDVYALSIANVPSTGLIDGVASFPSYYYAAPELELHPDGSTNVDHIIDSLPLSTETGVCTLVVAAEWATTVEPENEPEGGMPFPQVGVVALEHVETGSVSTAPIVVDAVSRTMSFRIEGLPAGAYQLSSTIFYRGEDQQTRGYRLLETADDPQPAIIVEVSGEDQVLEQLSLRVFGDVCAGP